MVDYLVDDPDAVAALSVQVAEVTGVPAAHVEKDFWVTEVLRGVVNAAAELGVEVIFKGGTSLSKAFSLIERFSEDVDILVVLPPEDTKGGRDRILKDLVAGGTKATHIDSTGVPEATTKGAKRGARFHYRPEGDAALGGLSSGVFLELGSRGGGIPAAPMTVSSLLAIHASDQLVGAAEVEPVKVRVLAAWRTLVEKLVLLHTAHSAEEPEAAIRGARHYYDVNQLLAQNAVLVGLAEHGVAILARDVCTYSRAAEMPAIDRPSGGFVDSPAFNAGPHVAAARTEYENRVLPVLLWPGAEAPTFDDCLATVRASAAYL